MSGLHDAVLVLGEERIAEIRFHVGELLLKVLADRARYARPLPRRESAACLNAAC